MNKIINFEDNVFILMMRIRMIQGTITLDADPELFLEKTCDDIAFIDQTLGILLVYLEENHRLIERDEFLEQFSELEWHFSQVIQEILNHNGHISANGLPSIRERLTVFRNSSLGRRKIAETLSPSRENNPNASIVSSDEISELLKAL